VTPTITIVLVEDHQVVREGLRRLLESEAGFQVLGDTDNGLDGVALVQSTKPDVLVADLMMPGLNGIEVTKEVKRHSPRTKVLMLSMMTEEQYVAEALQAGASGYVPKDASGAELVRAVREVAAGHRYLSPPLSDFAISAYADRTVSNLEDPYEKLTERERQVFLLAAEGSTSKDIAARLGIRPRTAESHRANVMRKLGFHNQTDLVHYAMKRGLPPTASGDS